MRSLLIVAVVGLPTVARADDTFETRETIGLDLTTLWEPANRDAFGAGPLFRFEWHSSKLPDRLDVTTRFGMIVDSADRVLAPISVGLEVRLGAPYVGAELGSMISHDDNDMMESDRLRLSWTAATTVGVKARHWDLRAMWMRGELFDGNTWLFAIGRDFGRLDATVTRKVF